MSITEQPVKENFKYFVGIMLILKTQKILADIILKFSARNWVDKNLNAELENINLEISCYISDDNFEVIDFTGSLNLITE